MNCVFLYKFCGLCNFKCSKSISKLVQLMPSAWKLDRTIHIAETILFDKGFLFLFFISVTIEKIRSASALEWGKKEQFEQVTLNVETFFPH